MRGPGQLRVKSIVFASIVTLLSLSGARAEPPTANWMIGKASGEVWVTSTAAQPASLGDTSVLKPGETIRTGRNGRVLLVRGGDTILIAPNSSVIIPGQQKDETTTTILQQAGSILLEVDRKAVPHFEVETPYLTAVVKGTQFRVSLNDATAKVDVLKGEVAVADLRSGQHASVLPGQSASVPTRGPAGLSLTGGGVLGPVLNGPGRMPSIDSISVPRRGLTAPRAAPAGQHVHVLRSAALRTDGAKTGPQHAQRAQGVLRIRAPLGEVRLNVQRATGGLARSSGGPGQARTAGAKTYWTSGQVVPGNGIGKTYDTGNTGSGNAAVAVIGSTNAGTVRSVAAGGPGLGGGNGNAYAYGRYNGNGSGSGNNGAGNGNGGGNGNAYAYGRYSGNNGAGNRNNVAGNGNGGNGNAFAYGHNGNTGNGRGRN
ncbi:FecR domain-containing protein [Rhodoplanes sp. SY1]|uniref:FecR domain-containing protein n=1 Tax=Rhodoplanes sp. SY1 TaxID=3166646 RepID=UPI0038B49C90